MKKIIIGVALLTAAGIANATDWELYARASDMSIFVATDRITRNGDYVETWEKFVYEKPQHTGAKAYNYAIDQITIYCGPTGNALRLHSITYYAKGGNPVDSVTADGDWQNIVPDSVAEQVVTRVCKA
jgi:hypothetical protein